MLLRSGRPPAGREHEFAVEVKWDGMRLAFALQGGRWCARSRPGRDCSADFPELATLAEHLGDRAVHLDGELVLFGPDGRPDFAALRRRLGRRDLHGAGSPATFVAFDILALDGVDLRGRPYVERRAVLAGLLDAGPCWRVPQHWTGALDDVVAVTREHELEGVVFKRLDSRYEAGRRSGAWLKLKHRRVETFAVTGWRPARPDSGEMDLFYVGRRLPEGGTEPVGGVQLGLDRAVRERLRAELELRALRRRRGVVEVADGVHVDVSFHGAAGGPLRDAVMQRLRTED
jgi:bifunctional non-homologous end joining protein LigD